MTQIPIAPSTTLHRPRRLFRNQFLAAASTVLPITVRGRVRRRRRRSDNRRCPTITRGPRPSRFYRRLAFGGHLAAAEDYHGGWLGPATT